jgi:glutathione S-transferase
MLRLYQFPISHYCEKVRWALAYKQLDHEVKNLLPGFHTLKTKKIAQHSSVPILVHDDKVIQGSDSIISYLDETFPEQSLTPEKDQLRDKAIEWEKYVDSEIGIHVRLCCYHILLEHPDIVIPFFTHNGPWYGKFILPYMFPKLKMRMREYMKINDDSAQSSKEHLAAAIDKLYSHLQEKPFLVGDRFTRADLAAASLLAPLCRAEKYGLNWPDRFPQMLQELTDEFSEKINWVHKVYEEYR